MTIERMGQAGDGVAKMPDGRLAFVPGALPGEVVVAQVFEFHKNFVRAQPLSWVHQSADRRAPDCSVARECGGCAFQHWAYQQELRHKEERVRQALARIAGFHDLSLVKPIAGARHPRQYRNKGLFPVGGVAGAIRLGLYRRGTHQLVAVDQCDIQSDVINQVLAPVQQALSGCGLAPYDERTDTGVLRHVLLRSSRSEQRVLVLLVVRRLAPELKSWARFLYREVGLIKGVGMNINADRTNRVLGEKTELLAGTGQLVENILGLSFELSFTSFFQVNVEQVEVLYQAAIDALPPSAAVVWDLYAGVGTLAALAARRAQLVRAVEINAEAVAHAVVNFQRNQLTNVSMERGTVEVVVGAWRKRTTAPPDAVIVDPPRSGLSAAVVAELKAVSVPRLVYVSCHPESWARDVAQLQSHYQLLWAQPVDMFARTDHVEVVAALQRRSAG